MSRRQHAGSSRQQAAGSRQQAAGSRQQAGGGWKAAGNVFTCSCMTFLTNERLCRGPRLHVRGSVANHDHCVVSMASYVPSSCGGRAVSKVMGWESAANAGVHLESESVCKDILRRDAQLLSDRLDHETETTRDEVHVCPNCVAKRRHQLLKAGVQLRPVLRKALLDVHLRGADQVEARFQRVPKLHAAAHGASGERTHFVILAEKLRQHVDALLGDHRAVHIEADRVGNLRDAGALSHSDLGAGHAAEPRRCTLIDSFAVRKRSAALVLSDLRDLSEDRGDREQKERTSANMGKRQVQRMLRWAKRKCTQTTTRALACSLSPSLAVYDQRSAVQRSVVSGLRS
eukprot:scaffold7341_cov229-Pinguiococcus_pyrenoidosus.AAC.14